MFLVLNFALSLSYVTQPYVSHMRHVLICSTAGSDNVLAHHFKKKEEIIITVVSFFYFFF